LTLIQLIGGSVLLILAIMTIVVNLSLINSVGAEIIVDIIFIIVGTSIIVLSVNILLSLIFLFDIFLFLGFDNSLFIKFDEIYQKINFYFNIVVNLKQLNLSKLFKDISKDYF